MSSDGGTSPAARRNMDERKDFNKKDRIGGGTHEGPVDDSFAKFLKSLVKEREQLDPELFPSTFRLVQTEIEKLSKGNYQGFNQDPIFIDLYNDPPVTLHARASPPSRLFPKFNYAGRIIGPKGSYLKALMKETTTKMVLLGKGVMKDKDKEEELRRNQDPKYLHLNEDMHVSIQVTAPAADAYKRMAYAINCLKEQVLSDNRTLEGLPWISNVNRGNMGNNDGGHGGHGGRPEPSPKYSQRSYPPEPPSRHRAPPAYDYGEPSSPVYRRYHHEMSPPPRSGGAMDNMKGGGYSDPYRQVESRGSYDDRRGSSAGGGGMRSHMSRSPPPSRTYPPAGYEDPYAAYYGTTPDPYYADNNGSYRTPSRGGKSSHSSTRYAPYKK